VRPDLTADSPSGLTSKAAGNKRGLAPPRIEWNLSSAFPLLPDLTEPVPNKLEVEQGTGTAQHFLVNYSGHSHRSIPIQDLHIIDGPMEFQKSRIDTDIISRETNNLVLKLQGRSAPLQFVSSDLQFVMRINSWMMRIGLYLI
jgi:hypothetical protein